MARGRGAFRLLGAILLLACAAQANAGGSESGSIDAAWFLYPDGTLFFYLSPSSHAGTSCAITERWAIDTTTSLGKSQLAIFMMAAAAGKQISVWGNDGCAHGNTEYVTQIAVN